MPTYEYRCKACGHALELFQSIKDRPVKKCPSCEARSLERLIGAGAGIIFKGSGFYITDNRQVSSPTLAPAKELDKPEEKKELPSGEKKKELAPPKESGPKEKAD